MPLLTLAQANKSSESAPAGAREKSSESMAVVVLDEAGHVRAVQREDGASMFRIDVATGRFLPQTGAVLIKNTAGDAVGAAGASGGTGDEDEAIGIAGITAAGLQPG